MSHFLYSQSTQNVVGLVSGKLQYGQRMWQPTLVIHLHLLANVRMREDSPEDPYTRLRCNIKHANNSK